MGKVRASGAEGSQRGFPEDQGAGDEVVEGLFFAGEGDGEEVGAEIVEADDGNVEEEAAEAEASESLEEADGSAGGIGDIETEGALAERGTPAGGFEEGEVERGADGEEGHGPGDEMRAEEAANFGGRLAGMKAEEFVGDMKGDGKEGDEDGERDKEDEEIEEGGGEPEPEAGGREGERWRSGHGAWCGSARGMGAERC